MRALCFTALSVLLLVASSSCGSVAALLSGAAIESGHEHKRPLRYHYAREPKPERHRLRNPKAWWRYGRPTGEPTTEACSAGLCVGDRRWDFSTF